MILKCESCLESWIFPTFFDWLLFIPRPRPLTTISSVVVIWVLHAYINKNSRSETKIRDFKIKLIQYTKWKLSNFISYLYYTIIYTILHAYNRWQHGTCITQQSLKIQIVHVPNRGALLVDILSAILIFFAIDFFFRWRLNRRILQKLASRKKIQ